MQGWDPGADPCADPGSDPGLDPGMDPRVGPRADPGTHPGVVGAGRLAVEKYPQSTLLPDQPVKGLWNWWRGWYMCQPRKAQ